MKLYLRLSRWSEFRLPSSSGCNLKNEAVILSETLVTLYATAQCHPRIPHYKFTLKMELAGSSEMVVTIYESVRVLHRGRNSVVIDSFTLTMEAENSSETLVTLKKVIFRFMTPCSSKRTWSSGRTYALHLQVQKLGRPWRWRRIFAPKRWAVF
jgi:hypothetical protein